MDCDRLTSIGYAKDRHIRLYGEEFRLISNPNGSIEGFSLKELFRDLDTCDVSAF